ncbi:MAG: VOC family protein [Betaproteobacteria bacterium]|nr:VOC family protein [Betaproteobacteria bacterium]
MFSHICLGISDFGRAHAFYAPIMAALELKLRFSDPARGWAAWNTTTAGRPLFLIGKPFNGAAHEAGNGQMVAFMARTRAVVDQAYALALANGGKDEGQPGVRPRYHANYYGAYFRDPDGNKVCVVCHEAEGGSARQP